ncbi:MAG: hypothetical protein SVS85_02970, partial [Candidatus Nanohaloarchaea archaeon]|nr:hypothetical protein [Candidatus Nanohaloarchaea archaeon]
MRHGNTLILLSFLVLISAFAAGIPVKVEVEGEVGGTVSYLEMNKNVTGLQHFTVQWYNSKSVNCKSRMEFHITGENVSESAWTRRRTMEAGMSSVFETYWRPPHDGRYNVSLRIHHCYDILEKDLPGFTADLPNNASRELSLEAENLPGGKVRVSVGSNRSMEAVVVPVETPKGWVFDSSSALNTGPEGQETATIQYDPSVWSEKTAIFRAVSVDGRYVSEPVTVTVKKESRFWKKHGEKVYITIILALFLSLVFTRF